MTGRTHDLAAFTALNAVVSYFPVPQLNVATAIAALGANMIGGLLPDIDNETGDIWDKFRFGNLVAKIVKPLIGGHRMISHSLLGLGVAAIGSEIILEIIGRYLLVDMTIVWYALMIGYLSHLVADTLTTEGVPWLFPVPYRFGFPPERKFRIKTGGWGEKLILFPGLIALNGYLVYHNYPVYLALFRSFTR